MEGRQEKGWPWLGDVSSSDKLWANLEDTGHGLLRVSVGAGFGKPREGALGMP